MKVISIIGRMADLDGVTAVCGDSCCFHPDNSLSFYSDTEKFSPITDENPYTEPLQRLTDAISGARKQMELLPRDALSKLHYDKEEWGDYVSRFCE